MIHCVIIEDEPAEQVLLQASIIQLFPELVIDNIIDNVPEAMGCMTNPGIDLVFLKNQLMEGYGFDFIKRTPQKHFEIILGSAISRYAIEALNEGVAYFLLKPFNQHQFKTAVEKTIQKISQEKGFITIKSEREGILKLDDIMFLHSDGPYTLFTLKNNSTVMTSKNLGYFEKRLPEKTFIRIHHSFIVNIDHVTKMEKGSTPKIILSDGSTQIPVSHRKSRAFFERFGL